MCDKMKQRGILKRVINNYELLKENQEIVKVIHNSGGNLHEVVTKDKDVFLVSMPKRFREYIWIKPGDFVVVEPITENIKVKAEIVRILFDVQINLYKTKGIWPSEFQDETKKKGCSDDLCNNDNSSVNINLPLEEETKKKGCSDDLCNNDNSSVSINPSLEEDSGSSDESSTNDNLFVNTNRPLEMDSDSSEVLSSDEEH